MITSHLFFPPVQAYSLVNELFYIVSFSRTYIFLLILDSDINNTSYGHKRNTLNYSFCVKVHRRLPIRCYTRPINLLWETMVVTSSPCVRFLLYKTDFSMSHETSVERPRSWLNKSVFSLFGVRPLITR